MTREHVEPAQSGGRATGDSLIRTAAWIFLLAWGLHGLDHLRRGMSASPDAVMYGGTLQGALVIVAIVTALRRHPRAPRIAIFTGILSAILVTYAHLLPGFWPGLQDSFSSGPRINVTWFSWVTAVSEIATGLAFAYAGLRTNASNVLHPNEAA